LDLEEENGLGMQLGCWEYYQNEPWTYVDEELCACFID
jgi:hypothetical protein